MEVKDSTYRGAALATSGGAHHLDGTPLMQPGEIANPGQDTIKGRAAIEAFLRKFTEYKVLEYELTPKSTTGDKNGVTQGHLPPARAQPGGQIVEVFGTFTAEWVLEDFIWHIRRMTTAPS
jgi:hypothetical protein